LSFEHGKRPSNRAAAFYAIHRSADAGPLHANLGGTERTHAIRQAAHDRRFFHSTLEAFFM